WNRRFYRACRWYADLLSQGFDRVPFFVVHDMGSLLLDGRRFRFRLLSEPSTASQELPLVRQRQVYYESRVLNRIMQLPSFDECVDALDEGGQRDEVIASVLERLLEPLRTAPMPEIATSAHLIRHAGQPGTRTPELAARELEAELPRVSWSVAAGGAGFFSELVDSVCHAYDTVHLRALLGPEDIFVIRHFDTLGSRAQRLTARQI